MVGTFECFLPIFLNFVSIIAKSLPSPMSSVVHISGNFSSAIVRLSQAPQNCSSSVDLIAEKIAIPGIFSRLTSEILWKD